MDIRDMGKRSTFERIERDFYRTPAEAVKPLLPHLQPKTTFIEPCAGDGALIDELERHGHSCFRAYDIEPQRDDIRKLDVFDLHLIPPKEIFITNPPWGRDILHPLIIHLSSMAPTWLLFDADWMHTRQSATLIHRCRKIVSVGRVKWIPDSPYVGKDNACWYLFDHESDELPVFIGRQST